MQKSRSLILVVATLAFVLLLGAGVLFSHPEAPPSPDTENTPCDPNLNVCELTLAGGGRLRVEFSPRPVPVMQPFAVRATLFDRQAETIRLEFTGVDMEMGFNRVELRPGPDGVFSGRASLPVCATGPMQWQANFALRRDGKSGDVVALRFVTGDARERGERDAARQGDGATR